MNASLPPNTITAPYSEGFEGASAGWSSSGLWNMINDSNRSHGGSMRSWYYGESDGDYRDGKPNSGDLTSPEIVLPNANQSYTLSFWYRYKTEGPEKYWDQRWIQISENGGPFINVLQLYDDPESFWLNPKIDVSEYAGSKIRVRFRFETLDRAFNEFEGWYIDDFDISTTAIESCSDTDNSPEQATSIDYGETKSQLICPSGDVDYYKFNSTTGDRIVIDIDTPTNNPPSDLDLYLFLLDEDGKSVLAEHDDEVLAVRRDPHLGYLIDRSGTYFLKVRSWAHLGAGGSAYTYSINLSQDNDPPSASFTFPLSGNYLPDGSFALQVNAADQLSGISHVDFIWHSGNWLHENWASVGSDWEATDGWSYTFDSSFLSEQKDIAFYAHVYDWAGNWIGTGVWELGLDRTPPVTGLKPLTSTQGSNAIKLEWSGDDNLSGIDYYDLQSSKNGGAWSDILPKPKGDDQYHWFIGQPGNNYGFRLRGVDLANNVELFPSSAETTTSIPNASVLCSTPDEWEDDNEPASANEISIDSPAQIHNFCNPRTPDYTADQDWIKFNIQQEKNVWIHSKPLAESVATILELYAADGITLLKFAVPYNFGKPSHFTWTADRSGYHYLRVRHLDNQVVGNSVAYSLSIEDTSLFMPLISK